MLSSPDDALSGWVITAAYLADYVTLASLEVIKRKDISKLLDLLHHLNLATLKQCVKQIDHYTFSSTVVIWHLFKKILFSWQSQLEGNNRKLCEKRKLSLLDLILVQTGANSGFLLYRFEFNIVVGGCEIQRFGAAAKVRHLLNKTLREHQIYFFRKVFLIFFVFQRWKVYAYNLLYIM